MNLEAAARQANRLGVMPRWADVTEEGRKEMARQMAGAFADEKAASAAIDHWLKNNQWPPTPADVWALAKEFAEREHVASDVECPFCRGTGFRTSYELWTYTGGFDKRGNRLKTVDEVPEEKYRELRMQVDGFEQVVGEFARACTCAYGKHLHRQRYAEQLKREAEKHK